MKWEYRIVSVELLPDIMTLLGQNGWELVSVNEGAAYFKREQQKVDLGKETVEIMKQILEQGITK